MKKFLIWVSLAVFLFVGIYAAADMAKLEPTYDGRNATVSVYDLIQDPESYDDSVADGAAVNIIDAERGIPSYVMSAYISSTCSA